MKLPHIVAVMLLLASLAGLIVSSVNAQERDECARWTQEAKDAPARWYSTDWQRAQCHAHGINLPDADKL